MNTIARANGRFDHALRRKAKRSGDERGVWLYVPAEVLDQTGFGGDEPAPFYRVWGYRRGSVVVRLYRER